MSETRDPEHYELRIDDDDKVSKIVVYFLWCDQGMANYVEVFEKGGSETVPVATALIDFGASSMKGSDVLKESFAPAVFTILNRMLNLMHAEKPPVIDRLIISHQDNDHWSLLRVLMTQAQVERIPLKFGAVRWGGLRWDVEPKKLLKELEAHTIGGAANIFPWAGTYTDYVAETAPAKGELFHFGDVAFRTLVVNVVSDSNSDSEVRNASGAIIVIDFGPNGTYVLPGDATVETLAWASGVLSRWEDATGKSPVRPCFALSAAHHGARKTIVNGPGEDGDVFRIAKAFIDQVRPYTVVSSAGARNTYAHPHGDVLYMLGAYVGTVNQKTHPIVFTNGVRRKYEQWYITEDIYTTVTDVHIDPVWVADCICILMEGQKVETILSEFKAPISTDPKKKIEGDKWVSAIGDQPPLPPPVDPEGPAVRGPTKRLTARSAKSAG